jgi:hypothetical protein
MGTSDEDEEGGRAKFIYFSTTDDPLLVESYYREALPKDGWQPAEAGEPNMGDLTFSCCAEAFVDRQYFVGMKITPGDAKLTRVTIALTYLPK